MRFWRTQGAKGLFTEAVTSPILEIFSTDCWPPKSCDKDLSPEYAIQVTELLTILPSINSSTNEPILSCKLEDSVHNQNCEAGPVCPEAAQLEQLTLGYKPRWKECQSTPPFSCSALTIGSYTSRRKLMADTNLYNPELMDKAEYGPIRGIEPGKTFVSRCVVPLI
jgi:hypothetical protein